MTYHMKPLNLLLMASLFLCIATSGISCRNATGGKPVNWQAYQDSICLGVSSSHMGLDAEGRCPECGRGTPCCNMKLCSSCASAKGICPFCGRKNEWRTYTDPETEVPLLLAMLKCSNNLEARRTAIQGLSQIKHPGTIHEMMHYAGDMRLSRELATAVGEFKEGKYCNYLKKVLNNAEGPLIGRGDTMQEYYRMYAAQAAAASLAKLGNDKAFSILYRSATRGSTLERTCAINALGAINCTKSRDALSACLREFFARNRSWKWTPGRELIGATLSSLSKVGDREAALAVLGYIQNPGCDFLYADLGKCLAAIGKPALPEIMEALRKGMEKASMEQTTSTLLEALGDMGDPGAAPFLMELLSRRYNNEYLEQEIKGRAIQSLGKLKAEAAVDRIIQELMNSKEGGIESAAITALYAIGGEKAFKGLVKKSHMGSTCMRELVNAIDSMAFTQISTVEAKSVAVSITIQKIGFDYACDLLFEPVKKGEPWAANLFFKNISSLKEANNYYRIVDLLHSGDRNVFESSVAFLRKKTKLPIKISFSDPDEAINKTVKSLQSWLATNAGKIK